MGGVYSIGELIVSNLKGIVFGGIKYRVGFLKFIFFKYRFLIFKMGGIGKKFLEIY